MSRQRLFLGIDLGTSGCRAVVIDDQGVSRAQSDVALPAPLRAGARVEQHPAVWWSAVRECVQHAAAQVDAAAIRSLAVDATSGTLLLADEQGEPLGPALMYNDSRARAEALRIVAVAPAQCAAHSPSSALAKLLHLLPHPRARHALHQADWIVGHLTGRWGISDENNCLKLGYDPVGKCWPVWLNNLMDDRRLLPQVVAPGTPIAPLNPQIAQQLGLPDNVTVVAGTTDSTAAFIATGAEQVGEAVTSLGSTLVMKVISSRPIFAPEYGVYSQPLGRLWLAGGGSNSGGAVLLHYFNPAELTQMTPRLHPDRPTGLDYYPLLTPGERFPVNDPHLPPRLDPRPDDDLQFFQAMLEGMARIEQRAYEVLRKLGAPYPTSVRSVGGGAANSAWTQIRQRMLNVPMLTPTHQDAAYGAALLARQGDR